MSYEAELHDDKKEEQLSHHRLLSSRASIDRINSDVGYVAGNIQWVSATINSMKNQLSRDEVIRIAKLIVENENIS